MDNARPDPRGEYARRLDLRRTAALRHARAERAISNGRLAVVLIAAAALWLVFGERALDIRWLCLPVLAYAVLAAVHERVIRARRRCERAAEFYERGIARLDDLWMGRGEPGERFLEEGHPFAADLDLFGRGSLFERICTARTRAGEETLARWLREPAAPDQTRGRQGAVEELRDRLDLREDLFLLGADVRAGIDPDALAAWGAAGAVFTRAAPRADVARVVAPFLALATVAALGAWSFTGAGPIPFLALGLIEGIVSLRVRARVIRVVSAVEKAGRDLALLSQVLERLERERFTSPMLAGLRGALETGGAPPSRRIARLQRLIELLDARRNQLFAPLACLLMWSTQVALAVEAWRAVSGPAIGRWLSAVGEMEALCALAGYAWENPEDPFPEIAEGGPLFEGEALGHPLIPSGRCVRNDLSLGSGRQVLIVSGSNMSGKSTMLRTVGINAVLAMAGAPVRARRLRLSPLALGASIRIHDSLQAGTSRFYAEITRLRQITDLTGGGLPVMFLVDEMLHGTNSHDRRIGAEAVVRSLVDRGAIGLITTHDLALAHIAEVLAPRAENVHFEDHLEAGRMSFDYLLRPGIVKKSNALELMRAVGLAV
ncbi:MAG TPA: DNA mismatch repair protein MutS [Candidatus Polarisedimenticolia bacterium]